MGIARRLYRPRVLALVFGPYFAIILFGSWTFASGLAVPWYGAELSRWLYMTYIVAAAVFLCGAGLLAFKIVDAFEGRIREVNRQLGRFLWDEGIVLPTDPVEDEADGGEPYPADPIESSLDDIFEALGDVQSQAVQEVLVETRRPPATLSDPVQAARATMMQRDLLRRRAGLQRHQTFLLFFLVGPIGMAVAMIGISMVMLPGTDAMLQSFHQLNTAVILGFSYSWPGLAAYFAASVLGAAGGLRAERKQKKTVRKRKNRESDE